MSSSKQIFFTPAPSPNNVYFDPSVGANGSVIWKIGTLPLPADPNDLLGKLTFKVKVTENCVILANANCDAEIVISGHMEGIGQISQTHFFNHAIIQGHHMTGSCIGEPIVIPYRIAIDQTNFVATNCGGTGHIKK